MLVQNFSVLFFFIVLSGLSVFSFYLVRERHIIIKFDMFQNVCWRVAITAIFLKVNLCLSNKCMHLINVYLSLMC